MGCDISSWVEVYNPDEDRWTAIRNAFPADATMKQIYGVDFVSSPFRQRHYGLFEFLAGIRTYSHCHTLAEPRGLPEDCDVLNGCAVIDEFEPGREEDPLGAEGLRAEFFGHSWLLLSELLAFDYTKKFWNRRISRGGGRNFARQLYFPLNQ